MWTQKCKYPTLKETVQAVDTYILYPYLRFFADIRKGKGQTNKFSKVTKYTWTNTEQRTAIVYYSQLLMFVKFGFLRISLISDPLIDES